jgi:hypothetical protein
VPVSPATSFAQLLPTLVIRPHIARILQRLRDAQRWQQQQQQQATTFIEPVRQLVLQSITLHQATHALAMLDSLLEDDNTVTSALLPTKHVGTMMAGDDEPQNSGVADADDRHATNLLLSRHLSNVTIIIDGDVPFVKWSTKRSSSPLLTLHLPPTVTRDELICSCVHH